MNPNTRAGLEKYREERKNSSEKIVQKTPTEKHKENPLSLRLLINAFCFECVGGIKKEITCCTATTCPLYLVKPYQKNGQED